MCGKGIVLVGCEKGKLLILPEDTLGEDIFFADADLENKENLDVDFDLEIPEDKREVEPNIDEAGDFSGLLKGSLNPDCEGELIGDIEGDAGAEAGDCGVDFVLDTVLVFDNCLETDTGETETRDGDIDVLLTDVLTV